MSLKCVGDRARLYVDNRCVNLTVLERVDRIDFLVQMNLYGSDGRIAANLVLSCCDPLRESGLRVGSESRRLIHRFSVRSRDEPLQSQP